MKHKAWGQLLDAPPGRAASRGPQPEDVDQDRLKRRDDIVNTTFVCAASFACGLVTSQRGPSILDLGYLTHSDLQHATSLFAFGAGGHLTGCLITGMLFDKFRIPIFLFWSLVGLSACTVALPWIPNYSIVAALYFFSFVFVGCVETGSYADVARRWGTQGGRVLQLLQLSFVAGGVLSPAMTHFFLMPIARVVGADSFTENGSAEANRTQYMSNGYATTVPGSNDSLALSRSQNNPRPDVDVDASTSIHESHHTTDVQYAYGITAAVVLMAAIPFLVSYKIMERRNPAATSQAADAAAEARSKTKRSYRRVNAAEEEDKSSHSSGGGGRTRTALLLLLVAVFFVLLTGVEESCQQFLYTFLTQEARWSSAMAALVTSWFWCGVLLVRVASCLLPGVVPHGATLALSCLALPVALAGVVVSAVVHHSSDGVWASVFFTGMGASLLFPAAFTWLHQLLPPAASQALAAVVMLSQAVAGVCHPILLGHLLQQQQQQKQQQLGEEEQLGGSSGTLTGFAYALVGEACALLALCVALHVLSRRLQAQRRRSAATTSALHSFIAATSASPQHIEMEIVD